MADINIVKIEDLGDCVARVIAQVNAGVLAAIEGGILAELPEFIDFNMQVVTAFQSLPMRGGETVQSTEKQGGTGTSVAASKDESLKLGGSTQNEGQRTDIHTETTTENITVDKSSSDD